MVAFLSVRILIIIQALNTLCREKIYSDVSPTLCRIDGDVHCLILANNSTLWKSIVLLGD